MTGTSVLHYRNFEKIKQKFNQCILILQLPVRYMCEIQNWSSPWLQICGHLAMPCAKIIHGKTVFILRRGLDTRATSWWSWASTVHVLLVTIKWLNANESCQIILDISGSPIDFQLGIPEISRVAVTGMSKGIKSSLSNGQNENEKKNTHTFPSVRSPVVLCWTDLLATEIGPRSCHFRPRQIVDALSMQ